MATSRTRSVARALGALSCVAAVLTAAAPSFAQESAADKAAADALFAEARKLLAAKKYEEACPKFAESYKLSVRLGTLLNLATCHEEQGKTASAWAEFNEALALAKRDKDKQRQKYAREHAEKLEKRLARIAFELPATLKDATLRLDGTEIGAGARSTPLPVDPGTHQIEVTAPGKKSWATTVEVKDEAATVPVTVPDLEPEAAPAAEQPEPAPVEEAPVPTPAKATSGGSTLGWVALGVGVLGVGAGSYFGLAALSKKKESEDHCGGGIGQTGANKCDAEGVDLRDQAKSAATLSTVGFAVGAVGIGAGIFLLATAGGGKEKSARALWVQPTAGPGAGGVLVGGRL